MKHHQTFNLKSFRFTLVLITISFSCVNKVHTPLIPSSGAKKIVKKEKVRIINNSKIKSIFIESKRRDFKTIDKRVAIKRNKILNSNNSSKNVIKGVIKRCYQLVRKKDLKFKGTIYISAYNNKIDFFIKSKNKIAKRIFKRCLFVKLNFKPYNVFKQIYRL